MSIMLRITGGVNALIRSAFNRISAGVYPISPSAGTRRDVEADNPKGLQFLRFPIAPNLCEDVLQIIRDMGRGNMLR